MPGLNSVANAKRNRRPRARAATQDVVVPLHPGPATEEPASPNLQDMLNQGAELADTGKPPTGWSDDDIDILAYLLFVTLFIAFHEISKHLDEKELAPQDQEIDRFTKPLARIIGRHMHIPYTKSGDTKDILAMMFVSASYGLRVYTVMDEKREIAKAAKEQDNYHAPSTPPPNGNGTVVTGRAAVPKHIREGLETDN